MKPIFIKLFHLVEITNTIIFHLKNTFWKQKVAQKIQNVYYTPRSVQPSYRKFTKINKLKNIKKINLTIAFLLHIIQEVLQTLLLTILSQTERFAFFIILIFLLKSLKCVIHLSLIIFSKRALENGVCISIIKHYVINLGLDVISCVLYKLKSSRL